MDCRAGAAALETCPQSNTEGGRVEPSFWDHITAAQSEINKAMTLIGGGPGRQAGGGPGRPQAGGGRRGRPPGAARAQTGGEPGGAAKTALNDLPGILARKYPQTGATAEEIAMEMGWKPGTPMSNLTRLVRQGSIEKTGDRYRATEAAQRAAA